MQKPWSFKSIEFATYLQIGLALVLIGSGTLDLMAIEMRNHRVGELLNPISSSIYWGLLAGLGDTLEKGGPYQVLGIVKLFFSELIISIAFLFVLRTKSLVLIQRTAFLALLLRLYFHSIWNGYGYVPHGSKFIALASILTVIFLFLTPVKRYVQPISQRPKTPFFLPDSR